MPPADGHRGTLAEVAVIVPVRGDYPRVCALLDRMAGWTDAPRETIVVSAGTDRALRDACNTRGCRYLESEPCRGRQLDMGARAARAEVLWFVHADAAPGPSSLGDIRRALARGAEGGHFGFAFSGTPRRRKAIIASLTNLRVMLGGIPYGDQGIFVRRDVYFECGGFPYQPLFEEVPLVRKLRTRGRFRALATPLSVSPRRWERDGWIRRSLDNRRMALAYLCGRTADRLAGRYDPPDRPAANLPEGGPQA